MQNKYTEATEYVQVTPQMKSRLMERLREEEKKAAEVKQASENKQVTENIPVTEEKAIISSGGISEGMQPSVEKKTTNGIRRLIPFISVAAAACVCVVAGLAYSNSTKKTMISGTSHMEASAENGPEMKAVTNRETSEITGVESAEAVRQATDAATASYTMDDAGELKSEMTDATTVTAEESADANGFAADSLPKDTDGSANSSGGIYTGPAEIVYDKEDCATAQGSAKAAGAGNTGTGEAAAEEVADAVTEAGDGMAGIIYDNGMEYSSSTILVSVEDGIAKARVQQIMKDYGLDIVYDYENMNMYAFRLRTPVKSMQELNELLEKLEQEEGVVSAQPDGIMHLDQQGNFGTIKTE